MRTFLVLGLLLVLGVVVTGFALGWFELSTSRGEPNSSITLAVDAEKLKADRDTVLSPFHAHAQASQANKEMAAEPAPVQNEREHFIQQLDTRFKAMDLNLTELQAKAKNGRIITRDDMSNVIEALAKKTQAARAEFSELKTAAAADWNTLKAHLCTSLDELKVDYEKAFARFMNEDAGATRPSVPMSALGTYQSGRIGSDSPFRAARHG
jgi:pyruvate/2-oxoglutarate dehydrogenase complex dihydrolipoamide acyltransferase (E2) component